MRYCSKCGAMNDTDANFCQGCGAKFSTSTPEEIKPDYTTPQPEESKQEQPVYQTPAPQTTEPYIGYKLVTPEQEKAKNRAIASMVLGICSIVSAGSFVIGLACGIIALVLGVKALKEVDSGMAKAGKITGIIGIVFSVLTLILLIVLCVFYVELFSNIVDYGNGSYYGNDLYDYYDDFFDSYQDSYDYFYNLY